MAKLVVTPEEVKRVVQKEMTSRGIDELMSVRNAFGEGFEAGMLYASQLISQIAQGKAELALVPPKSEPVQTKHDMNLAANIARVLEYTNQLPASAPQHEYELAFGQRMFKMLGQRLTKGQVDSLLLEHTGNTLYNHWTNNRNK
jgi:hypothetical protein